MPAPLLRTSELTKRYGSATVLEDVSISLERGRVHALMGENGAGKSTFIKLIAGETRVDVRGRAHRYGRAPFRAEHRIP